MTEEKKDPKKPAPKTETPQRYVGRLSVQTNVRVPGPGGKTRSRPTKVAVGVLVHGGLYLMNDAGQLFPHSAFDCVDPIETSDEEA